MVAVANKPIASFALAAALGATLLPDPELSDPELEADEEELLCRDATTPPTTAPTITTMATGTPN